MSPGRLPFVRGCHKTDRCGHNKLSPLPIYGTQRLHNDDMTTYVEPDLSGKWTQFGAQIYNRVATHGSFQNSLTFP